MPDEELSDAVRHCGASIGSNLRSFEVTQPRTRDNKLPAARELPGATRTTAVAETALRKSRRVPLDISHPSGNRNSGEPIELIIPLKTNVYFRRRSDRCIYHLEVRAVFCLRTCSVR